jgi:hypothetical protein
VTYGAGFFSVYDFLADAEVLGVIFFGAVAPIIRINSCCFFLYLSLS